MDLRYGRVDREGRYAGRRGRAIQDLHGQYRWGAKAAGGKPAHIVKVQVFLTDINDRSKINPLREAYFGEHRPASTLVEVSALIKPELKVEIEAEAIIPG